MLSAFMLSVVRLSIANMTLMISVSMLSVFMLSVVMLIVMAPFWNLQNFIVFVVSAIKSIQVSNPFPLPLIMQQNKLDCLSLESFLQDLTLAEHLSTLTKVRLNKHLLKCALA
jgi:hypothetical protein